MNDKIYANWERFYKEGRIDRRTLVKAAMVWAGGAASMGVLAACGDEVAGQLEAVIAWVEENKAPERLLATGRSATGAPRSRPVCAYPLVPKYKGGGSTDEAANFSCSASF